LTMLYRVKSESLNLKSAFFHLLGDLMATIGVLLSGLAIGFGGDNWLWLDPFMSIAIAALLGFWAIRLIQETAHILMEGTPYEIDIDEVRRVVEAMDGIREMHDLHIWTLTSGFHTMTAHVVADHPDPSPSLGTQVREALYERFGLGHVTIQVEDPERPCEGPHA
jgi:cobalt-zinc-cadmium efflux system protein